MAAEAEADASNFYGGAYGYGAAPLAYGGYGAAYGYGYTPLAYGYGHHGAGYGYGSHFIGKREAEADASLAYGYAPLAYAYNPIWYAPRASSHQHIATPFSVSSVSQIHKREAEPEADASLAYGYAPLAYAYNPIWYAPRATSHQTIATPFSVSSVSQIHKREAEPEAEADASLAYGYAPLAYGYGAGIAAHPGYATSFEHRSPQGLHSLYRPYGYGYAY